METYNINLNIHYSSPKEEWEKWIALFKEKSTGLLGYEIGEPEDGFEFRYYE